MACRNIIENNNQQVIDPNSPLFNEKIMLRYLLISYASIRPFLYDNSNNVFDDIIFSLNNSTYLVKYIINYVTKYNLEYYMEDERSTLIYTACMIKDWELAKQLLRLPYLHDELYIEPIIRYYPQYTNLIRQMADQDNSISLDQVLTLPEISEHIN